MPLFMMYLMGFVQKFTRYGRWADLALGLVMISLGVYWRSPWTAGFGMLGVVSFAIDLNGMIQRRTLAFAHARAIARKR